MVRLSFEWLEFAFEWLVPFKLFEFAFEWFESRFLMVRICIQTVRILLEWFELAFEWLESLSNG